MYGVDISEYQPANITASIPYDFVIIKATEGVTFVNPRCDQQYQAAKARGKLLGVYHFATGNSAPEREAEAFYTAVQGYLREAVMVLDFEQAAIPRWGDSGARRFLDHFTRLSGGIKPLIYAQASIIHSLTSVAAGDYGLWLAAWDNADYQGYRAPSVLGSSPFPFTVIRQYTSRGRLPGYGGNLDLDIAYIDAAAWRKYANPSGKITPPLPAKTSTLLTLGSQGSEVRALQAGLNRIFPAYSQLAVDGIYGERTRAVIREFQQRAGGLTIDGIVGEATRAALARYGITI